MQVYTSSENSKFKCCELVYTLALKSDCIGSVMQEIWIWILVGLNQRL